MTRHDKKATELAGDFLEGRISRAEFLRLRGDLHRRGPRPVCFQRALLVDRCGGGRAHGFILRTGPAGAADRADDLAVFDQRNTADTLL